MTCFVELILSGLNRQLELLRGEDQVVLKILLVLVQILFAFLQHTLEPQPLLVQVLTHFLHLGEKPSDEDYERKQSQCRLLCRYTVSNRICWISVSKLARCLRPGPL